MDDATAESDGDSATGTEAETETETEIEANGITARYKETDAERLLEFDRTGGSRGESAVVAQNREGYAMLMIRRTTDGDELERYYGFDMALDHAAELLEVTPHDLPIPENAADMGM